MKKNEMLLQYMDKHYDEFVALLEKAALSESPTEGDKEDLKKCRDFFENLYSGIGFKCQVIPSNNDAYGEHLLMEYGEGENQILFIGHYDTVYPKGTFGEKYFYTEGNRAYGAGVYDMKGGVLQAYIAVRALIELDLFPKDKKIKFFLSCDEETGSIASHDKYKEYAKESTAALVFEPAVSENVGDLVPGRMGRGYYTIVAEGHSAHSGQEPEKAESGLIELAKQAVYLESLTDLEKGVTVGCTSLTSGYPGWCTVPGDASLTFDFRCTKESFAEEYDEIFQNLKPNNPNVKLTTLGGIDKPVFDITSPKNIALFKKAASIAPDYGFEAVSVLGRGGSDGNFAASTGCPTLDGMCLAGNYVHQPGKEFILLDSVVPKCAFTAGLILEI